MNQKLLNNLVKTSRSLINLSDSKHHFSFIIDKNQIISIGKANSWKSHPLAQRFGHRHHCIHSELAAILSFNPPFRTIPDYTFINIRLLKDLSLANSKPCGPCTNLLKSFGVSEVIYSTSSGFQQIGL